MMDQVLCQVFYIAVLVNPRIAPQGKNDYA